MGNIDMEVNLPTGAKGIFTRASCEGSKPTVLIVHGWGSDPFGSTNTEIAS